MKTIKLVSFSLTLLSFNCLSAANDLILDSHISEVTIFADRAEITRSAKTSLEAGTHTLLFVDLPTQIDKDSLQVNGIGAFTLQDVRFETRQLTELPEGRLKELHSELEQYDNEAKALNMTSTRLRDQRNALEAIIKRVTTPPKESTEPAIIDADHWTELLSFYNSQLEQLDSLTLENDAKLKSVTAQQARIGREISQLSTQAKRISNTAKIVVSLQKPSPISINLTSIVYGPRWTPSYDIRANTEDKKVTISSYGSITQNTGEDWSDIQLKLSTAQPQVSGREPTLTPWFLSEWKNEYRGQIESVSSLAPQANMMKQMMEADQVIDFESPPAPMEAMSITQATVYSGATSVVYEIPNKASVPSDNQPVRVSITEQSSPGHFRYSSVPKLSPHTYLKTKVTNTSEYAFLPGPSNIYLNGSFVGKAPLDLVSPGKEFWTWLGIDQGVSVERKTIDRKEGDSGFFGGNKKIVYRYEFDIKNNKQSPIELVVWDQLPIPQNEAIKVELNQPKYTEDSDTFKMNSQKFVEWIYQLVPGATVKTPYEFTVSYPKDMNVAGLQR